MKFILDNYLVIILVGLFFVFALIGYLIDILRKNNESDKNDVSIGVKPIEMSKLNNQVASEPINSQEINKEDELLNNYNNDINE